MKTNSEQIKKTNMEKIKELLLSLGMTKVWDCDHDAFFLLSSKVPIFGEVVRLFYRENKVVFFTNLKKRSYGEITDYNILHLPYTHLYSIDLERIPEEFKKYREGNHFFLDYHLTEESSDYKFLKWLVTDCNKQKKELEKQIMMERMKGDFE